MDPPNPADMKIDSAKFKEVIERLKKDRTIAVDIHNILQKNQQIRRNADNIVNQMPREMGQEVPLGVRKKMAQQQVLAKQLYTQGLLSTKGEVSCIMIPQKGSSSGISSYRFLPSEMEDEKWNLHPAIIEGLSFVAVCNSRIMRGQNKNASKLIGTDAFGPVILILLNENYVPIDMEISVFKKLIE